MAKTGDAEVFNKLAAFDDNIDDDDDSNPWEELLTETKQSSSKLSEYKNVLLLGDLSCGKTTLIAKLQNNEEPEKGSGLEFSHITVQDEYREDSTALRVWYLDGDSTHAGLLKYVLTPQNFTDTHVLICVSMSHPWSLLKSITDWLTILSDHIDRIELSQDTINKQQQTLIKEWKEYVEPDSQTSSRLTASTGEGDDLENIQLGENVLINNLGLPITICVTKSDNMSVLEKEDDYKEEKFDFIQLNLRKLSLQYGASLLYLSVKEEKNCDLLLKYLSHKIYGLEFKSPAQIIDKDSIFIPAGWDSDNKISILADNLSSIKHDEDYESVVKKPMTIRRALNRDAEVIADDEQDFLTRCHTLLAKGAPAQVTASGPDSSSPMSRNSSRSKLSTPPGGATPTKKEAAQIKTGQAGSETVLANFFNSLLHKKSASPSKNSPTNQDSKEAARAELDRMSRKNNSTS